MSKLLIFSYLFKIFSCEIINCIIGSNVRIGNKIILKNTIVKSGTDINYIIKT